MGAVHRFPERSHQQDLFPLINPGIWQGKLPPRREWMVEGLFAKGTVGLLAGNGGIGKSLIAQQLCTCAVLGRPWIGLTVKQGAAVYFACEDEPEEIWRRQNDINRHYDCEHADLGEAGLHFGLRLNKDNRLCRIDRDTWKVVHTDLYRDCLKRCMELGARYFVIDTQAQVYGGRPVDMGHTVEFMAILRRLAVAIGGLVLLLTHPSQTGKSLKTGEFGSVQWVNASRSFAYLHKDKGQLVLEHKKGNYGKPAGSIPLEWRDGVFVAKEMQKGWWESET